MARTVTLLGIRRGKDESEAIKTEIQNLDPDKFIGTIGIEGARPTGAVRPHYTTFPATPEKGNWLRVVSETTIDGKNLLIGQEWICAAAKTETKKAVWEEVQGGQKKPQYATYANNVGELIRLLDNRATTNNTVKSDGSNNFVKLFSPFVGGVFDQPSIRNSPATITNLGNLVTSKLAFDVTVEINFTLDLSGVRTGYLYLISYYPDGTNLYDLQLNSTLMKRTVVDPRTPIILIGNRLRFPETEPFDETPLTYVLGASVSQDSGVTKTIDYCTFKLTAWD